jgi:hypothetical protein
MLELGLIKKLLDVAIQSAWCGQKKRIGGDCWDNLDRIVLIQCSGVGARQNISFIDRGDQLRQLNCHLVYTLPLGLILAMKVKY